MNTYDFKIEDVINKYFDKDYNFDTINPIDYIGKIIKNNIINKKFAIWGSGEHTENLYKYFSVELRDCMFIIDNNKLLQGKRFLGYKVINPKDIEKYDLDVIFISSYGGRIDIKKNIQKLLPKCKAIDFYEILKIQNQVKLNGPFYLNENTYIHLYKLKKEYEFEQEIKKKESILRALIYSYLKIRDFYNVEKFINKYIENNYYEKEKFIMLLKEVGMLVSNLKEKLVKRQGNDILLLFLDSLRAKDVYAKDSSMNFLNGNLKNSMYFTNAFSPSIFTYESVPSIFSQSLPFNNELYKRKTVEEQEVPFIQKALKEGYSLKIYSTDYWNIISGKNIQRGDYSPIMSENIWNALCDLSENKNKNTIYLLYFLQETHPPHICGEHIVEPIGHSTPFTCNDVVKQSQEEFNIQYNDCLKYVDKQLECYFNIMGNNITKVIFSDHGQIVEKAMDNLQDIGTLAGWHDDRYHVPLILNGNKIKPLKDNNIFSMVNFNDLVISIMSNKEYKNNQKYVEVNFSKICNDIIKQKYMKVGYDDYLYGFRVLRNSKYKLVITGNEKYKVYVLPEQFEECRDENIRKQVINYFSKIVDISVPKL